MYGVRPSFRQRRIKPIARAGAIDVAVRYDIHAAREQVNHESSNVLEGELVFSTESSNLYRDHSLHVLSNLALVRNKKVKFQGVAVTSFDAKHDVYEQGFVIQVSGLCSVFNNSEGTINPGQKVYAVTAPSHHTAGGTPFEKRPLRLTTLQKPDHQFVGTCVKGGQRRATIDIVLHRGPVEPRNARAGLRDKNDDERRARELTDATNADKETRKLKDILREIRLSDGDKKGAKLRNLLNLPSGEKARAQQVTAQISRFERLVSEFNAIEQNKTGGETKEEAIQKNNQSDLKFAELYNARQQLRELLEQGDGAAKGEGEGEDEEELAAEISRASGDPKAKPKRRRMKKNNPK